MGTVRAAHLPCQSGRIPPVETEARAVHGEMCLLHPERPAVERCEACGRAACLPCAVPVRGQVLCTECARREVGVPAPTSTAPSAPAPNFPHIAAASLFGVGVLATIVPWDRFGVLTSVLSAWRPDPEPWPLVASISLLLGVVGSVSTFTPSAQSRMRSSIAGYTVVGVLAAAATTKTLLGSPSYVSHTFAPYLVLSVSLAASTLGVVAMRRRVR